MEDCPATPDVPEGSGPFGTSGEQTLDRLRDAVVGVRRRHLVGGRQHVGVRVRDRDAVATSLAAVGVYVAPLAKEAGLSVSVARTAISVGRACQMAGGGLAAFLAGRVRYIAVFWVGAGVFAATWMTYGGVPPARPHTA